MASGSSATPAQPLQVDEKGIQASVVAAAATQDSATAQEEETSPKGSNDERDEQEAAAAGESYEETHVHKVYEAIAPHFSATRHKPWPFIASFLAAQPVGSVGLDVGCGNGKYLPVNPTLHLFGSDRSASLVRLARTERQGEVAVADGLALPYRRAAADFAICIAVIHHLSTQERRRESIAALLECVKPVHGKVLIYVWALEQSSSRRGWDEGSAQDRMVPWVMRSKGAPEQTFQRYYHLYRQGELEEDVLAAGGLVVQSGYEKDNWYVICSRSA